MPPGAHRRPRRFRRDPAGGVRDGYRPVTNNNNRMTNLPAAVARPVLIVPYMWIGDFVRYHSVVKVLKSRWPHRPVDVLPSALSRPLADYMPGLRQAIVGDLPRGRIALGEQRALAERLRANGYGLALIMPRTWKAALAPFLAGIPQRVGFVGEARFGLLNDWRRGERKLPRMVDRCGALALPEGTPAPAEWPLPELVVPAAEVAAWRERLGLEGRPAVALCPGAVGPSKRWTAAGYGEIARTLTARGIAVWVIGGPDEARLAGEITAAGGPLARDLTGPDLRNALLALAAANAAVSNDSGLLHVAAAGGAPASGDFGPPSPWHWGPLHSLAARV